MSAEQSLDSSLRDLVERILPLATYYLSISSFIEMRSSLEFGLVNHALCAALRDMLKVIYCSFTLSNNLLMFFFNAGLPNAHGSNRALLCLFTRIFLAETMVLRSSHAAYVEFII